MFFEKDKTSLNTYPTLLLYQILTFEQTNQTNLPKSKILSPVIIDQAIRRSKNCKVPGCIAALLFSALESGFTRYKNQAAKVQPDFKGGEKQCCK